VRFTVREKIFIDGYICGASIACLCFAIIQLIVALLHWEILTWRSLLFSGIMLFLGRSLWWRYSIKSLGSDPERGKEVSKI